MILRKLFVCWWGGCQTFLTKGNDTHLWGECGLCGKKSGKTSRASIQHYVETLDRQERLAADRAKESQLS